MASSLHWKQTSLGIYQRDVDATERFYLSACLTKSPIVNKADWHLNAGVKLECSRPYFGADAKKAWVKLRSNFPAIAAKIIGEKWIYHTANQTELDEWLEETFHVHRQPFTARELMSEGLLIPAPRVVLHVLPNTQELMLQGPHTHLDGFGLMKTFQHLITYLVGLPLWPDIDQIPTDLGSEERSLSLPMSLSCRIPSCSAEDKLKWDKHMEEFIEPRHKIYLSTRNEACQPRFSRTQWLVFDASSTSRLQQEAQKHGVSLAAIVQGAISLSAREHGGNGEVAKRHAIQGLYSAREYIDSSIADEEGIVSPLVLGVPLTYTLHDDFPDLISDVHTAFQEAKVDKFGLKCSHIWGLDLPKAFAAPLPRGKLIRAEAQMSYMGPIDSHIREWNEDESSEGSLTQCIDYWSSLDVLSANVVTGVYIFRGRLNMSLAYNETFHSEESMSKYLQLIKTHINEGLGIHTEAIVRRPGQEEWMPGPIVI